MQHEDYFEFVEPDHIRIKGHRIGVESIICRYLAEQPVEQIVREYDTLRPAEI